MRALSLIFCVACASIATAGEFHVAVTGDDGNPGTQKNPLRTIQAAAVVAQPGDTITVHSGVYRERISPPRGGTSNEARIIYQAAPGEKVVITGSERIQGWEKVAHDTWKVVIPNEFFKSFNPFAEVVRGDWCSNPRAQHCGAVYHSGDWLLEATKLDEVLQPQDKSPLWFAQVDGASSNAHLVNLASFTLQGTQIAANSFAGKQGELHEAPCSEGGNCIGWVRAGNWLRYEGVECGAGLETIDLRVASQSESSEIEIRQDHAEGELLGKVQVTSTGDWQEWATVTAHLKPVRGKQTLCLVFRAPPAVTHTTTIWAQFADLNPNEADVEISARSTVFTPEKPRINYLTVRGFTLRQAATNWAPPTASQIGLVSAYWNKGWIIENNDIGYSACSGIALGKYGDEWDNRAESAEGYVGTLTRALKNGWNRDAVGSHVVRNNHIHHCEQAGVVGSLGCSFSTITGNEIHDIWVRKRYSGAEMAAIKFHGAIDVLIADNHLYRNGCIGLWLDWMAQGAQVVGNLFHDNGMADIFCEMQHGPLLLANNLFLSREHTLDFNSQGIAVVHNFVAGSVQVDRNDDRVTPFHKPHTTELAGMHSAKVSDSGDYRFHNNLFVGVDLHCIDRNQLPNAALGNVFIQGSKGSKLEKNALALGQFDAALSLQQQSDGWYLTLAEDPAWRDEVARPLVTTALLGPASVSNCPFEQFDGSPLTCDQDYFGTPRDRASPFPGPFEKIQTGRQTLKVWPKP